MTELHSIDPRPLAGRRFHMLGIGGAGVSALAQLCAAWGAEVSGCDPADSSYAELVRGVGVKVSIGHDAGHVEPDMELVVSSAVPPDHPEILRARELGVSVVLRGALLGELTRLRRTVVVAGAHGKSTTSAMLTHLAIACGVDVSAAIGGVTASLGGNVRVGSSPWFVVEGDESDRTLALLVADVAIVTNIERDHHHTYASDRDVFDLFAGWVASLAPTSTLVLGPGPLLDELAICATGSVVRFGADDDELVALEAALPIPGRHNALNAAAALAAAELLDVPYAAGRAALTDFAGVGRRFEQVGTAGGARVVDDYAHHPTEVAATIAAARTAQRPTVDGAMSTGSGRVVVVFQPHLYSRTQALWREFASALSAADAVVLAPIYGAREAPIDGVTSALIADELERIAPGRLIARLDADPVTGGASSIAGMLQDGDLVLTMGAGSITRLAPQLVDALGTDRSSNDAQVVTSSANAPPEWFEADVPLHRTTTIGTGGPARWLARPESLDQLRTTLAWAATAGLPTAVIGLGSNSLIADGGFDGVAVRLNGELAAIDIDEDARIVRAGGGASLAAIVRRCRDAGLAGFEWACAVPGTVGGAVKMNAGAYGGEMVDVLDSATIVGPGRRERVCVREATAADLDMQYRQTNLTGSEVVAGAVVSLVRGDPEAIKATVRELQARRSDTQPRAARSFGSVFRNPRVDRQGNEVLGAGALIDSVGLPGRVVGGARISPKHGNFIENTGDATTADVLALIDLARSTVLREHDVELVTEVHLLDVDGYRWLEPRSESEHGSVQ